MESNNPTTIAVGPIRFSYLNLWEPKAIQEGQDPKFSVSAIIPKSDKALIKKIENAIEAAKQLGKDTKFKGKIPAMLKLPLRDGDLEREDDEAYKNSMFFNANNSVRPGAVDQSRNVITDRDELQSGDYGYVNVSFYAYTTGGKPGIGVSFNHIMKTKTGERLSGKVSIDSAFEEVPLNEGASDLM